MKKKVFPKNRTIDRFFVLVIVTIICIMFISGCYSSVTTRKPKVTKVKQSSGSEVGLIDGIPYFLPKALWEISFESKRDAEGNQQELMVNTSAKMVPDPSQLFVLESAESRFLKKKHNIKVTDGMLSLITTEDDSKIGEIIANLLSTAVNVFSFGATGGIAQKIAVEEGENPTNEEIQEVYSSISPGKHTFTFEQLQGTPIPLIGTSDLLLINASSVDTISQVDLEDNGTKKDSFIPYQGIYTRVLIPKTVTIELSMSYNKLYDNRLVLLEKKLKTIEDELKTLPGEISKNEAKLKNKQVAINDIIESIAELEKKEEKVKIRQASETVGSHEYLASTVEIEFILRRLDRQKAQKGSLNNKIKDINENLEELQKSLQEKTQKKESTKTLVKKNTDWKNDHFDRFYTILSRNSILLAPDETVIAKIPLSRSILGTTKHTITLDSGVLIEYETDYPSAALELVKIPLNISKELLALPTMILKLKVDYANKEKELAQAIKEQNELLAEIKEIQKNPSDHDLSVKTLEQEKEILELTKNIEILRSEVDESMKGPTNHELEIKALEQQLKIKQLERDLTTVRREIEDLQNQ